MSDTFIIEILAGITCGSLGFGLSQLLIVGEVKATSKGLSDLEGRFNQEQRRTDERIFAVTGLVEKAIDQSRELVAILRARS